MLSTCSAYYKILFFFYDNLKKKVLRIVYSYDDIFVDVIMPFLVTII